MKEMMTGTKMRDMKMDTKMGKKTGMKMDRMKNLLEEKDNVNKD